MLKLQEIFPEHDSLPRKALTALLALVAFSLPTKITVNVFIVLSLAAWLFSNPFKALFIKTRRLPVLLAIVLFYVLHAIALLYTRNLNEGLFSLEIKISLFIFPLVFYSVSFSRGHIHFFVKAFIAGCLLCCALCLGRAAWMWLSARENYFYYSLLGWFQHPSYLAMYLTFCCCALLLMNVWSRRIKLWLIVFFSAFIIMLSSKTGIIIHFVSMLLCVVFLQQNKKHVLMAIAAMFALIVLIMICVPGMRQRFDTALKANHEARVDKTTSESTAVRLLIWNEAMQVMKEHPLMGVSPGDANDELYQRYQTNGLSGAFEHRLNAHSQYFQTSIGLGMLGLASLLSVFVFPLLRQKGRLKLMFLLIVFLHFFTESMLQTMAGCIFFGYFYGIVCLAHHDKALGIVTESPQRASGAPAAAAGEDLQ